MKQSGAALIYLLITYLISSLLLIAYAENMVTNIRQQDNWQQYQEALYRAETIAQQVQQKIDGWYKPPQLLLTNHCQQNYCITQADGYQVKRPLLWWQQHAIRVEHGYYLIQQVKNNIAQQYYIYRILALGIKHQAKAAIIITIRKRYTIESHLPSQPMAWWKLNNDINNGY